MKNGYFEFLVHFVDLTAPRAERGRNHNLLDMVALALCDTIAGVNSWAGIESFCRGHQDWFEEFLELPCGIPSPDTFGRVFARLETEEFPQCQSQWGEQLQFQLAGETVAIDGTTWRGSQDRSAGQEISSVLRRLAPSILKSDTTIKDHVRGKRLIAGWNLEKMKAFLFAFQAV